MLSKGRAITLHDVAQAAGVSEITVSRVLRSKGAISEKTRLRVMEAVRDTGYVHNKLAGSLASSRSNLVGVVLPSLSNSVFPEVMEGINKALARSGFQPVVGVTNYDMDAEEVIVRSMLAWKPAAMIISGLDHTRTTSKLLDSSSIRVIEIMDAGGRPIDVAIGLSHRDAGIATAEHLLQRGYRNFGYVGHDLSSDLRAAQRHQSFVKYLTSQGITAPVEYFIDGPSSIGGGRSALESLLRKRKKPEVVVFSNDDMAVGGMFHCYAAGLKIKTDIGIFGFNGLDMGQELPQPLSTIKSNRHSIGQIAVETFMQQPDRPDTSTIIDTGFTILQGETA
ncbi:LacI family DNA-binding transcriptional regulator [Brucella gallinifaecis]|uniref:LacI family DNA-binding transcriptional regulator n=1 Tax=Brucella gallinifaecis TaxID=215590 RepID=A0A502BK46_9HYPH|nr:LacI family DNA-binding transcriptional regulator [Brucella gallinifaecis]TPF74475.1 LacI family DNA-binding transcriptional regulator [Brucella gallinifaecis]